MILFFKKRKKHKEKHMKYIHHEIKSPYMHCDPLKVKKKKRYKWEKQEFREERVTYKRSKE